jgi:tetratricopeptide (TPR) repeat protein
MQPGKNQASEFFGHAAMLYAQGNAAGAAAVCRDVLALDPQFAEALHLLGIISAQDGDLFQAVELLNRAATLNKKSSRYLFSLGAAYHSLRDYKKAESALRKSLSLKPDFAEAHYQLGLALEQSGKTKEAENEFRRATALAPAFAPAYVSLAQMMATLGRDEEAEAAYRKLIDQTGHPAACNDFANFLYARKRFAEAEACYRQAIANAPQFSLAYVNLANLLEEIGQPEAAEQAVRAALEHDPANAGAYCDLALYLKCQGKWEEAISCYRQALRLQPDAAEATLGLSMLQLLLGRFEEGWRDYEARLIRYPQLSRSFSYPMWRGEAIDGKTILVWGERGLGDEIHFVRYIRKLQERGARVIFECRSELAAIFENSGIADVRVTRAAHPRFDEPIHLQAPLLSLPHLLATGGEAYGADVPYLRADAEKCACWKQKLADEPRVKVGVVWSGNPDHARDKQRSLPPEFLESLASLPEAAFYSLQMTGTSALQEAIRSKLIDVSHELVDFNDTAACISALDMVVSVDTSVAHMAGALGKRVLILLPFDPDWRWGLESSASRWYPSATLLRQARPGDWAGVVAQAADEVKRFADTARGLA